MIYKIKLYYNINKKGYGNDILSVLFKKIFSEDCMLVYTK